MNAPKLPLTNTKLIPLNQLLPSDHNVRRTRVTAGIGELAASIAAHGLRQNLNVLLHDSGTAEVVAGGRRLLALKQLADEGALSADWPVPCIVLTARENAREISLAENTMRTAMHPDDEFEAFNGLVAAGLPIEDVAQRFGVTPAVVKRRLKLAAVSPRLRKKFRNGKMTLAQITAFTLTDDVKKQEKIWRELDEWERGDPGSIKAALTENTFAANHKLVKFVGLKAYEKAGGTLTRDLFDTEASAYLDNPELLQQLAEAKLDAAAEKVRQEGWGWVKASLNPHWEGSFARLHPTNFDADKADYEEEPEAFEPTYDTEQMKGAGARVSINYNGKLSIDRGLIAPGRERDHADGTHPQSAIEKPEYTSRLMLELAHQQTTALRQALSQDPKVALVALTHALASQVLYESLAPSALNIRAVSLDTTRPENLPTPEENSAVATLGKQLAQWRKKLPADEGKLFGWLMKQKQQTVLDLLILSTSLTLEAVPARNSFEGSHQEGANLLSAQLTPDFTMADYWEPTAGGFLSRLSKAQMIKALTDTGQSPLAERISKMKRDEAIRETDRALHGKRWLPTPLQPVSRQR